MKLKYLLTLFIFLFSSVIFISPAFAKWDVVGYYSTASECSAGCDHWCKQYGYSYSYCLYYDNNNYYSGNIVCWCYNEDSSPTSTNTGSNPTTGQGATNPTSVTYGYLSVRVTDCSTGAAISNARVDVSGVDDPTQYTDSSGYTSFYLSPGTYSISASKSSYQTKSTTQTVYSSQTTTVNICLESITKPCSISATVSTPPDAYVGDIVSTTVKLTNSGDVGGWVDVKAYLCRTDPSCWRMNCDRADPYVSGRSTYTLTCSITAPQEGYYYIKVDSSGCDADPTIRSGTFQVRSRVVDTYCQIRITDIILERDGADPTTFYLGDNIRVSADVYVAGADPLVTLKMYVDNRYYDSESVNIPMGSSRRVTFDRLIYTTDYGVTDPTVKIVATADCDPTGDTKTKSFSIVSRTYQEGYLPSYRCSGNWRQQLYQYPSGATQWRNIEYCSYGCSSGYCLAYPVYPTCQISLVDKSIPTSIQVGDSLNIWIKLKMTFQDLDPWAKTTVYVERTADPHTQVQTFYFPYSGATDEKTFTFSTLGWQTGTYSVYVSSAGQDGCGTLSKTYIGSVSIRVGDPVDPPPVAVAGSDQIVYEGMAVTLSASGSYDSDGYIVSYEWREGSEVLSNSVSFTRVFSIGTHVITLTVTDNDGNTASDIVVVTVKPASGNSNPSSSVNSVSTSVSTSSIRYVTSGSNVHTGNAIYVNEIEVARDISPKHEDVAKAQVWSQTQVTVAWEPIAILVLILLSGISVPLVRIRKSGGRRKALE